ncbi:MAG: DNA-binding protein [Hyphomicrobium sp.]|nr:MAG: DNA-binding protein [Hyphomicrobium sp.]PPD01231.1 MAG: DNA-binding protein [Hyphomicrobium sp.]
MTEYLTTKEAARIVRLSPRTLERLRLTGDGPKFLKAGIGLRAKVLYRITDLQAWIERSDYQSTAEYQM